MPVYRIEFRTVVIVSAAMSLAGCLGGGSSGAGGGGPSDISGRIAEIQASGPTTNMPTSLNARYEGEMRVEVRNTSIDATPSSTTSGPDAIVSADLEIDVEWNETMGVNADISGRAHNFSGTAFDDGEEENFTMDGELTVRDGSGGIARTEIPQVELPDGSMSPGGLHTGGISFVMEGTLTDPVYDESVSMLLSFGGTFYGDDAASATGVVSGTLYEDSELSVPDGVASGEFYLIKQP